MAPIFDSPPATPNSFSQPRPRPPRSPGRLAQIRTQNRRRAYLERHEAYFQSTEHELADPLLYDALIRRFQTPSEREAEGRAKGYARVLEGSLLRGEERLAKLREQTVGQNGGAAHASPADGGTATVSSGRPAAVATPFGAIPTPSPTATTTTTTSTITNGVPGNGAAAMNNSTRDGLFTPTTAERTAERTADERTAERTAEPTTPPPQTRDEGRAQWEAFLRDRFIRGEDEDFDYGGVDGDDEYDVLERVEREEAWFEAEDPGWEVVDGEGEGGGEGGSGGGDWEERGGEGRGRVLRGETGVQDF